MIRYAIVSNTTKRIVQTGLCPENMVPTLPDCKGYKLDEDEEVSALTHYFHKDGGFVEYAPEQRMMLANVPEHKASFDHTTFSWVDARTVEEIKADALFKRAQLLSACDWTQAADSPVLKDPVRLEAWSGYRQALRDITIQPGFPTAITWPTPPSK